MKVVLYKPQTDDLDIKVAVYANEAWFNIRKCTENSSDCGDKRGSKKPFNLFLCKKGKDVNQTCPID